MAHITALPYSRIRLHGTQPPHRCLGSRAAPQGQRVSGGRGSVGVACECSPTYPPHTLSIFLSPPLRLSTVHDRAVPPSLLFHPPPCAFAGLLRWPTDLSADEGGWWMLRGRCRTPQLWLCSPPFRNPPALLCGGLGLAVIQRLRRAPNSNSPRSRGV
ncbi:unnamed protein product [Pleuronectes platessa]|uniref:Uncharacterized protein n=1 Tax=Pleuronectes platessa TaxID=8262 RepID=A0A9N7VDX5_PLEPL|nr:unnamed protein product [Pleuronectes platessa]